MEKVAGDKMRDVTGAGFYRTWKVIVKTFAVTQSKMGAIAGF